MPIRTAEIAVQGVSPLLLNNPRMVDRFDPFARRLAAINAKKTARTDDDFLEMQDIEMEAKLYFDEGIGVYVPSTWVAEAIATAAFRVAKISKANVRGAMFTTEDKIVLSYRDSEKVKGVQDVVKNPAFRHLMALKQWQARVIKAFPIFHRWSFSTRVEFDDKIMDPSALKRIAEHTAKYGGFGDFRPKFGRAEAKVTHV